MGRKRSSSESHAEERRAEIIASEASEGNSLHHDIPRRYMYVQLFSSAKLSFEIDVP